MERGFYVIRPMRCGTRAAQAGRRCRESPCPEDLMESDWPKTSGAPHDWTARAHAIVVVLFICGCQCGDHRAKAPAPEPVAAAGTDAGSATSAGAGASGAAPGACEYHPPAGQFAPDTLWNFTVSGDA